MGIFDGIWLAVLGILAAPNIIVAKKPEAATWIEKLRPYQGWMGVISVVWGVIKLIKFLGVLGMLGAAPILTLTFLVMALLLLSLGLLLGINVIKTFVKDASAQAKMDQIVDLADNVTDGSLGHAQVHAEGYLDDRSIYKSLASPAKILAAAKKAGFDACGRSYGFGLVATGKKSGGASFWGIYPPAERAAFRLPTQLKAGRFISDTAKGEIVIGSKLARSLHAELGSEIVALVQAADGSLGNELYRVAGILKAVSEEIDRGGALLHRDDFERLFLSGGRVHEIAINTHSRVPLNQIGASLGPLGKGAKLQTWRELMPAFAHMMDMSDGSVWLFAIIFYLAAAIGVMNTMLMATHDRVREYGVAKALGATPWRIIRDVAAEGWMLSLVSTVIGALLGVAGSLYLKAYGIDFSSSGEMTTAGVSYPLIWHGNLTIEDFVTCVVTMWIISILASLYPAVKAARLQAVDAITHV
jgi:ABC-type lipoprotein release transport system permease subunit